jgi:hypothetical protein
MNRVLSQRIILQRDPRGQRGSLSPSQFSPLSLLKHITSYSKDDFTTRAARTERVSFPLSVLAALFVKIPIR